MRAEIGAVNTRFRNLNTALLHKCNNTKDAMDIINTTFDPTAQPAIRSERESGERGIAIAQTTHMLQFHDAPPGIASDRVPVSRMPTPERRRFYGAMVEHMKETHGISIRKWRKRMSGVAYELRYSNGDIKRMISSPRPRSAVSACIFLHEVGHHAIGFRKFRPRCLEEYHVWQWAFRQMRAWGIPVDARVTRHYRRSMYHYVRLAQNRGLKRLPALLEEFRIWPA